MQLEAQQQNYSKADMKAKVFAHLKLIDTLASKKFPDSSLSEEAAFFVLDQLEQNDWHRVRGFQGKSKFSSFLAVLSNRLLNDFSRKKFGRVRPPVWVKKLGGIWLEVFKWLCLERLTPSETVVTMQCEVPDRSAQEIEEAAHTILLKISSCGEMRGKEEQVDNEVLDYLDQEGGDASSSIEDTLQHRDQELMLDALFQDLLAEDQQCDTLHAGVQRLQEAGIELTHEDRLLLRLRFSEGMTFQAVGDLLGINEQKVRRKIKSLLEMLRENFVKSGLDDLLLDIFSS